MVGSGWHIIKVKVGLTVRGELLAKVGEVIWHWLVVWVWVIMGGRVGVVLVTSLGLVGRGEQVSGLGLIGRVELVSGLGLVGRVQLVPGVGLIGRVELVPGVCLVGLIGLESSWVPLVMGPLSNVPIVSHITLVATWNSLQHFIECNINFKFKSAFHILYN